MNTKDFSLSNRDRRQNIRILVYFTFVLLAVALSGIYWLSGGPLVSTASARAEDPLWQELAPASLDALRIDHQSWPAPKHYRAIQLNEAALTDILANAPMEFTEAAKDPQTEIALPMPDGAFARFRFVESPIMEPKLAEQFPEIKTYRGWGIDDPTLTMRFARTSGGFHAIVLSPKGAAYVAPLYRGDTRSHASYFTRDASGNDGAPCLVEDKDRASSKSDSKARDKSAVTLDLRPYFEARSFRLAVAVTGEYSNFFGGTVAAAMNSGIVPTVNNVMAIYQQELSVSFTLVANNAAIIFTNPLNDPYTNGNISQLLDENQSSIDNLIREENYDIGHVFDMSNAGGAAIRGVVCNDGDEAQGVSTSSSPTGTAFDLIVAHEFGHQFNAHHTFNGTMSGCGTPGQLNEGTAYEPGSGSTIMAYPGLCGSDNIQSFPDPYFHWQSLEAMAEYLENDCACAASTDNGSNTPPAVTPPFPQLGFYLIPRLTPFALTASATDAEDTNLTFCWEQADNGSPGPPTGDRVDNPLFRSFPPTSNPTRTFPQMSDVLNNTTTLGETMPTTQRRLTFVVTARDNHSPGGTFGNGAVLVDVWALRGPFVVTAPAAGTQALEGSLQTVTWDVANTDLRPISVSSVRILLSTDGGDTFPTTLATSTQNDGSFTFTVPHVYTDRARIKVEAIGNIFFNVSPAFTIIPRPTITVTGSLTVTRGGPSVTAPVAVVADGRDAARLLTVTRTSPNPLPTGVTLNITADTNGIVSAEASAQCNAIATTRLITLQVTNSAGLTATATFNLVIDPNPSPTLGAYNNVHVVASQNVTVSPSAPPSDPNGNLSQITAAVVVPSPPPSNVTPLVNQTTGVVTILTTGSAQLITYQIQVVARDTCGGSVTRNFFVTVDNSGPQIAPIANLVRTTQGATSLPAPIAIATVSDQQDAAGALQVTPSAPSGLSVSLTNSNGTIMASATAICTLATGTYSATVTVRDSSGETASTTFTIVVDPNPPPTLGTYLDSGVTVGGSVLIVPNVPPSDPNNAVTVTVNPMILPGGGQVIPQANGRLTVNTVATTVLGIHQILVTARDSCNAQTTRSFKLNVRSATCIAEQSAAFVADTGNHRIQRFSGGAWNVIGPGTQGSGLGQFTRPESVVASPDGQKIYVADTGNGRIQWSQDSGGTWSVFAIQITPQGLVLDRDGNLYVSDAQDSRVVRYGGGVPGTPIVLANSGSGAGRVSNPNGLAIDCLMNLYIADTGNNRILVIATADSVVLPNTGTVLAGSGAGLNPAQVTAPQGLAVDNAGKLYVADTGNDRVLVIASAPVPGAAVALCTFGPAPGQVRKPEGVTIAAFTFGPLAGGSSILVSDTLNSRVQGSRLPIAVGSWMNLGGPGSGAGQFTAPSKIR